MTKTEIITHLVAAYASSHPQRLQHVSETTVHEASLIADWILCVEDIRTPEQRAKQEMSITVQDCER